MALTMVSFKEAITFGFDVLKKNAGLFFQLFLFWIVYSIIVNAVEALAGGNTEWPAVAIPMLIFILFFIVNQTLFVGSQRIILKLCDGKETSFSELFSGFDIIWNYIVVVILMTLILVGGFLLLIIPGIIWGIKFQFAPLLVIDKGMGPIEALKKSSEMTKGIKWKLFNFGFFLFLINILGLLCLLVGVIVTALASSVAATYLYRKLVSQTEIPTTPLIIEGH